MISPSGSFCLCWLKAIVAQHLEVISVWFIIMVIITKDQVITVWPVNDRKWAVPIELCLIQLRIEYIECHLSSSHRTFLCASLRDIDDTCLHWWHLLRALFSSTSASDSNHDRLETRHKLGNVSLSNRWSRFRIPSFCNPQLTRQLMRFILWQHKSYLPVLVMFKN